jgi:hypothetical protein
MAVMLILFKGFAQLEKNVFSFNYVQAPIGSDNVDFYKTEAKLTIPTKVKKGILLNSIDFKYYQFNYNNINL